MIKILDIYLIRQFLQTIIFGLITFTLIFLIIDMIENLDNFIDRDVPGNIIFQFYVVFIPEIQKLMTPVAVLLASLFVAGKMSNQNELIVIKASGISLYRYMAPFIAIAFIISILSIYYGGYLVPIANKHKFFIEREYMNRGVIKSGTNIYFQDAQNRIVSISSYNVKIEQAYRVSIQEYDMDDITKMTMRIDASKMRYDSSNASWDLFNGSKRIFRNNRETLENFSVMTVDNLNFLPDEILKKQRKNEEMTLPELKLYAKEQLRKGNDPNRVLIEYHSRFAFAFASLIVVLFGIPISANKRKGGLALQFGLNLLITFIYLVFMQISKSFGKNGVLDPVLTAWFANFIFFLAAAVNLIRVRK